MNKDLKKFMCSLSVFLICCVVLGPLFGSILGLKLWGGGAGDIAI